MPAIRQKEGVVTRCVKRQDGTWFAVVKIIGGGGEFQIDFGSVEPVEGKRLRLMGSGKEWSVESIS